MAGDGPIKIALEGDWSIRGITEQVPLVKVWLTQLVEHQDSSAVPELDLTGIAELDACGCQLLAIFMSNLRMIGFQPVCKGLSESLKATTQLLGFSNEFVPEPCFSKDCL